MPSSAFRRTALFVQSLFNRFDPTRRRFPEDTVDGVLAPLLLVGPPRTGSTYVYQLLIDGLGLAYISNAMALLPALMIGIQRMTLKRTRRPIEWRRGDYGFLPGLLAPSEAGKILDRWFDQDLLARHRGAIRRTLSALSLQAGAPVCLKSPSLVRSLSVVLEVLPHARFVALSRSPAYVAQSLIEAWRDPTISADVLLGAVPPGFEDHASHGRVYQIVWQIRESERALAACLDPMPAGRVAHIRYEEIFRHPRAEIRRLAQELGLEPGTRIERLPEAGEPGLSRRVDEATWLEILDACRKLGVEPFRGRSNEAAGNPA